MSEALHELSTILPVPPERVYAAWLDSTEHGAMIGSTAQVDAKVGGSITAWGDYTTGTILELEPGRRIVQSWRTTDFAPDAPDSRLEIILEPVSEGTRVVLDHLNLPDGSAEEYRAGWVDYYFAPMLGYFAPEDEPAKKPARKAAAKRPAKKPAAKRAAAKKAAPKKKAPARKPAAKKPAKKPAKKAAPKKGVKKPAATKAGKRRPARKPAKAKR
jgi:uncharacterized protein YndB with AHSA1/START domain